MPVDRDYYGAHYCLVAAYFGDNSMYAEDTFRKRGDSGSASFILLEAVALQELWNWHAFFDVAGSSNDINVIRQSPLINDLKIEKEQEVPFVANNVDYR
uniref:Reverse transcriptase domain-containing protein n=1 Tax=Tanacetum cinerariifolium TaxID=118510 RepID=A0A6L2LUV9_TANCI|nr:reverse transcriptase domain-containing protein [Tanacetum cinerariifolium]